MRASVRFLIIAGVWFGGFFFAARAGGQTPPRREVVVHEMLLELDPWYQDRGEVGRSDRLWTVARALVAASDEAVAVAESGPSPEELDMLLLTVSFWESRFARHVHAGDCRKNECDKGLARGVNQVQLASGVPRELWEAAEGLAYENTLASMRGGAWVLTRVWARCHGAGQEWRVFGAYARGRCNADYQGPLRVTFYRRKLAEYRKRLAGGGSEP